jgi:hypothetical protein
MVSMKTLYVKLSVVFILIISANSPADCPLDHLLIGCNPDGIAGTDDDMKLFVDCTMKYRHSDPNHSGEATWLNRYYPLYYNERHDRYQIDEPGFELVEDNDPNRRLKGIPDVDYRIIIRCLSISRGFAVWNTTVGAIFDEPGDTFNYSGFWDSHLHLQYRTTTPAGKMDLLWATFQIFDGIPGINQYEASEPFTLVFAGEPLAGDLAVNGTVDIIDVMEFSYYWLRDGACRANDYYERADTNRDGKVDFYDFALVASNWGNSDAIANGNPNSENCE